MLSHFLGISKVFDNAQYQHYIVGNGAEMWLVSGPLVILRWLKGLEGKHYVIVVCTCIRAGIECST